MGRVRQIEDAYSDPASIATKYRAGTSIYFEVTLALAEYDELVRASSSGTGNIGASGTTVIFHEPPIGGDGRGRTEDGGGILIIR